MRAPKGNAVSQQKISDDFDRHVESYDAQINDAIAFSGLKAEFFIRAKCEYLLRLAQRHFGQTDALNVLDLGCGVGNYHLHLAGAFGTLSGIDVSARSIDYARRQGLNVSYSVYPGGSLPYEDKTFDLVFTSCVLHHVPVAQWPEFVSEMLRVLRGGGLAVVFEHNPFNPITRRIVGHCPIDEDAVLLPMRQTRGLFAHAGFQDITTRSIFSIPPLISLLYPVDEALGVLRIGAQYYLSAKKRHD